MRAGRRSARMSTGSKPTLVIEAEIASWTSDGLSAKPRSRACAKTSSRRTSSSKPQRRRPRDDRRHLQRERRQRAAAGAVALAQGGAARHRLPAGIARAAGENSRSREIRKAGLSAPSGMGRKAGTASPSLRAAPQPVETRRGLPGDPDDLHSRYLEAEMMASRSAASICPTAIPRRARSSTTSWPGSGG